jgi:glutamate-ammonia-ligase adenylyltransferase
VKTPRPTNLPTALEARFELVAERLSTLPCDVPAPLLEPAIQVCTISEFVLKELLRDPVSLLARVADPEPLSESAIRASLDLDGRDESEAMERLRRYRNREMARIAWRDIVGLDDLDTNLANLSALAEASIIAAHDYAIRWLSSRFERPLDASGRPVELIVLALGKLGGGELNFSSDIDLVFLCPDGVTFRNQGDASAEDYFLKLAQSLIRLLDQVTADGFVFRVDTRLRPFGNSGPLVITVSAFEAYLISHGRDWERYAYQKARLVTGRAYESEIFGEILSPFVYRRYLDFGVFAALRTMKSLIRREVARREMSDNIKLGPGGIREIEFVVQAIQLLRGGHMTELRESSLRAVLPRLSAGRQLGAAAVESLLSAYVFLRTLENRLQALNDRQTHMLPAGAVDRARLAYAMREPDWDSLLSALDLHRTAVEAQFDRVVKETRDDQEAEADLFLVAFSAGRIRDAVAATPLADNEPAIARLETLRASGRYARMDEQSRQRLIAVLGRTLPLLEGYTEPDLVLERVMQIFESVCRRSAYLVLLDENPRALENLLTLVDRSGFLTRQLAEQPLLLDELLDPRVFESPPSRREFKKLLENQLGRVADNDVESSLDAIRAFHGAAMFRVAIADTIGRLPLMKVSDRLTDIAELVVQIALDLATHDLRQKYGRPLCGDGSNLREAGFAVMAYGKLAGLELGYGSDLDLVFVHDSSGEHQETDAAKPTHNDVYFARLAQRLIHFLSIQTRAGRLYEVDTRLRPGGESGQIVTSFSNFCRYQREDAWVWEHQALLRSRTIAGTEALCAALEDERLDVLQRHVDRENLREKIIEMRLRMRRELSKAGSGEFDLKQDEGGLADIEFIVDFLVLGDAERHPELVKYPDNIRQIEALEGAGLLAGDRARDLISAYLSLRQRAHDLALGGGDRVVGEGEFLSVRKFVRTVWDEVFH